MSHPSNISLSHRSVRRAAAVAALLLVTLCGCADRPNEAVHFTQVEYRDEKPSIVENGEPPSRYHTADGAHWTTIDLPHVIKRQLVAGLEPWDRSRVWTTHWYRLKWTPRPNKVEATVLYIPRRHQSFGRMDVYVDGIHVARGADAEWNDPDVVLLPPPASPLLERKEREVLLALSEETGRGGAISTVWVGPADELQKRAEWRRFIQRGIPQLTSVVFLVFGAFALAFWWRRREPTYLIFGLMAPVYCLRSLHLYVVADGELGSELFWWMTINSLAWLQVLVYLFGRTLHGRHYPRIERVMFGTVFVASVVSLVIALLRLQIAGLSPFLYLVQLCTTFTAVSLTLIAAIRSRVPMALALAVMQCLFLLMGAHDWLLQSWRINVESVYLLSHGSILVFGVALYAIFARYIAAVNEADRFSASLELRLAERTQELEESHRKLRLIEHEHAVAGERQRLMREMHDGLGSSLMASLVMVEQGELDKAAVAKVLRESIDDLKLTIDSLEPMGNDLLTLLGTLRYRLGNRLAAAGIKFEWQVQETPPLPWLNPTASLQVLRILQEALANILKHAGADVIRVETGADDTHVFVRLLDNGRGFDVAAKQQQPTGRGLQNLNRRAATLNGCVEITSRPGETSVTLLLPLAPAA